MRVCGFSTTGIYSGTPFHWMAVPGPQVLFCLRNRGRESEREKQTECETESETGGGREREERLEWAPRWCSTFPTRESALHCYRASACACFWPWPFHLPFPGGAGSRHRVGAAGPLYSGRSHHRPHPPLNSRSLQSLSLHSTSAATSTDEEERERERYIWRWRWRKRWRWRGGRGGASTRGWGRGSGGSGCRRSGYPTAESGYGWDRTTRRRRRRGPSMPPCCAYVAGKAAPSTSRRISRTSQSAARFRRRRCRPSPRASPTRPHRRRRRWTTAQGVIRGRSRRSGGLRPGERRRAAARSRWTGPFSTSRGPPRRNTPAPTGRASTTWSTTSPASFSPHWRRCQACLISWRSTAALLSTLSPPYCGTSD